MVLSISKLTYERFEVKIAFFKFFTVPTWVHTTEQPKDKIDTT